MKSFRPLTGIMVLINNKQEAAIRMAKECFRPLTGIMVLILTLVVVVVSFLLLRFRPLTGIMVLIKTKVKGIKKLKEVSVPLRGLWFLS